MEVVDYADIHQVLLRSDLRNVVDQTWHWQL